MVLLTAFANPVARYAAIVVVASGVGFFAGMKIEANSNAAALRKAELAVYQQYKQEMEKQRGIAQAISKELVNERAKRAQQDTRFRAELRKSREAGIALASCEAKASEDNQGREVVAATPRFSAEYARLFDLAIGAPGVPGAADSGRADGAAPASGTVDAETVLDVHQSNAAIANACRDRLAQWQALARANGWVK